MCTHGRFPVFPWSTVVDDGFGDLEDAEHSDAVIEDLLTRHCETGTTRCTNIETLEGMVHWAAALGLWFTGHPKILEVVEQFANTHSCPTCKPKEFALSRVLLAEALYFGHCPEKDFVAAAAMLLEQVITCMSSEKVLKYKKEAETIQSGMALGLEHPFFWSEEELTAYHFRERWSHTRRAWIQAVIRGTLCLWIILGMYVCICTPVTTHTFPRIP